MNFGGKGPKVQKDIGRCILKKDIFLAYRDKLTGYKGQR